MWLKKYKPYTPSRRFMTWYSFEEITKTTPEKSLTVFIGSTAWRNNKWRITTRSRWWWHKRLYRIVDFRWYDKLNIPAKVSSIEYDPYRTARIALLKYADWEKRYVLAWKWIKLDSEVICWDKWLFEPWNRKQLSDIPDWFNIFNLEVTPFTKWKYIKSAWNLATITGRDEQLKVVFVRLPSWEVRKFNEKCWATIWELGNEDHKNIVIGKAWRMRWMWRRPHVLWKSMNPVDHPHGWWEWHTDLGLKYPKSYSWKPVPPWKKTRKKKKWSTKFIVTRRTKN